MSGLFWSYSRMPSWLQLRDHIVAAEQLTRERASTIVPFKSYSSVYNGVPETGRLLDEPALSAREVRSEDWAFVEHPQLVHVVDDDIRKISRP